MKSVLGVVITMVFFAGGWFVWQYEADLHYLSQQMAWEVNTSDPLNSRMQEARTHDTNQLVLRQVDRSNHLAVFVSTTMDNRFEVLFLVRQRCGGNHTYPAILDSGTGERILFQCDPDSGTLSFRRVWKKPASFHIIFNNQILHFKPAEWALSRLKKDQFMQLHARFYQRKQVANVYEWRRD
ncbi:hypothetical protein [Vibrio quintilis]|uniref:Uncharacterized protein n=1 Tax=Vibrio quintilis TaxID=1117707 RepID=A0A1M7Z213_9VIBR|nr:hypothetical protein [Vibrio quintilis]SHO59007.1 hypothetical protein VQ7734_04783 [Vibrio quintilis]